MYLEREKELYCDVLFQEIKKQEDVMNWETKSHSFNGMWQRSID